MAEHKPTINGIFLDRVDIDGLLRNITRSEWFVRSFQNDRAVPTQSKATKREWHNDAHFYFSGSHFIGAFPNIKPVSCGKPQPSPEYPRRGLFQPKGGCTDAIISEIEQAKTGILVQAYSFTSASIAKALVSAHKKGVKVLAILDKSQRSGKYTSATFLMNAGIPTLIDAKHAIAHNKIMIIDKGTVITGSFNFTKAAEEKNAENVLIIKDKALAKVYLDNWQNHREHSEPYGR
jgi:phosphatidylserine/phosphatidylglycerophosphate/cardiolipin synthase-like enzyme